MRRRLDTSLPSMRGDRIQLQQVMLNFVGNGVDAMAGGLGGEQVLDIITGMNDDGEVRGCRLWTAERADYGSVFQFTLRPLAGGQA